MRATINFDHKLYTVDFSSPIDLSIVLQNGDQNLTAWYIDPPIIEPFKEDKWVAKVSEGASINFNNVHFNPHGHGTHTECVGHITEKVYSINDCLKSFVFMAELITVVPEPRGEDFVITKKQVVKALKGIKAEAVVIRTLPNTKAKAHRKWSHTNWPYLEEDVAVFLRENGTKHLLIDLPSVDRERDEGRLVCHNAFWNTAGKLRMDATITELIFVPHTVKDGSYLLNLQIASFENDASPSKPVLYAITPT